MIVLLSIIFALCFFLVIYTYIIYPVIMKFIAKFKKQEYRVDVTYMPKVSVLVAAYNEEKVIAERIENLLCLVYPKNNLEILIGSDGSIDRTVDIMKNFSQNNNIRLFDMPRGGKVSVLNRLILESTGDILVFTDANTMFKNDAINNLVKYFADERVGCVSGQLRLNPKDLDSTGSHGESTYWKYENWVKEIESSVGKLSGANGAIYAVKKSICPIIKEGIINDDFYISTHILSHGYDVIMNHDAIAYEEPNDTLSSQFNRHIRDGAGHYQALSYFTNLLSPFEGLKFFTYVSHRVIRWIAPFCIITAFILNAVLVPFNTGYFYLFSVQAVGYLLMIVYYFLQLSGIKNKVFNIPFYFLCVNLALFLGFVRHILKLQKQTWETQR